MASLNHSRATTDRLGRVLVANPGTMLGFAAHQDLWQWGLDRRTLGLATAVAFLVLTAASTAMRMYTRFRITRTAGLDDYSMVVAQALFVLYCALLVPDYIHGFGHHRDQLTPANAETTLKLWFMGFPPFSLATASIKVSLGLFLLRFAKQRIHKIMLFYSISSCIVVGLGYFTFILLACNPYSFLWDLTPGASGLCFDSHTFKSVSYSVAAVNMIADIFATIIPTLIVLKVSISVMSKVGVFLLLGLGSVTIVSTAFRIYYSMTFDLKQIDFTFESASLVLFTTIELGSSIIATNLATLQPLFKIWARRFESRRLGHDAFTRADAQDWLKTIPVGLMVVRPPSPVGQFEEEYADFKRYSTAVFQKEHDMLFESS